MFRKTPRDARLALPWVQLVLRSGASRLVTPFDTEKSGMSDGHQAYRDAFGRVGHVPLAYFHAHARAVAPSELPALLPPLHPAVAAHRFPAPPRAWPFRWWKPSKPVPAPLVPQLGPNVQMRVLRRARRVEPADG